jgi:hypothetical protein
VARAEAATAGPALADAAAVGAALADAASADAASAGVPQLPQKTSSPPSGARQLLHCSGTIGCSSRYCRDIRCDGAREAY